MIAVRRLRMRLAADSVVLVVILAALVGLVQAPADAETRADRDPAGDVVAEGPTPSVVVPMPGTTRVDVRKLTVRHGAREVAMRLHLRNVPADVHADPNWSVLWRIAVEGRKNPLELVVLRLDRWEAVVVGGALGRHCKRHRRAVRLLVAPRSDYVGLSIPTRCLGTPRWVRVGAAVTGSAGAEGETGVFDFSHRIGAEARMLSGAAGPLGVSVPMGSRVRRG